MNSRIDFIIPKETKFIHLHLNDSGQWMYFVHVDFSQSRNASNIVHYKIYLNKTEKNLKSNKGKL